MTQVVLTFIFTIILICFLIPIAKKMGLVDTPNHRKIHTGSIPLVGGIAIYFTILAYFVFSSHFDQYTISYIIGASMILIVGILDDLYDVRVRYRLIAQIASSVIIIASAGLYFDYLGQIGGIGIAVGIVGIIITMAFFVANINSYNMVDGIDGLLGMLSLISMITLAIFLSMANSIFISIPVVISAAIIAYLVFNFNVLKFLPRVFVGDSGAMFLGYTISWLILVAVVVEHAFRPVILFYIIAVPLMDLVFNTFNRLRKGQSPIRPQRDHVHHRLMNRGYSSLQTVGIISSLAVFISTVAFVGEYYKISDLSMLMIFIFFMICYTYYFVHTSKFS
ncbi:MAG: hypothetical protein OCD03_15265 [Hyphomicrobiales bacterium]